MMLLDVDARRLPSATMPSDPVDLMEFLLDCVAMCDEHESMPLSARTALFTVLASHISVADAVVDYDDNACYMDCVIATRVLCSKLLTNVPNLVRWISEVSPFGLVDGVLGPVVKGIRVKY